VSLADPARDPWVTGSSAAERARSGARQIAIRAGWPVAIVIAAAVVGRLAATSPRMAAAGMVAMAVGAVALALRPSLATLVLAWLVVAPVFQNDARASDSTAAHLVVLFVYRLPPLLFLAWLVYDRSRDVRRPRLLWQDWLPVAFMAVAVVSLLVRPPVEPPNAGNPYIDGVYWNLAIPIIAYYVCAFGRLGRNAESRLLLAVMVGGALSAVLAIFEQVSGTQIWGATEITALGGVAVQTLTGTLSNPTVLGQVTGSAAVLAACLLIWREPSVWWRRAAVATLIVAVPVTVLTYERAAVLAMVVGVLAVVASRRRVWNGALVAALGLTLAALLTWGFLTSASVYETRVTNSGTVETRLALAERSVQLFAEHPVLGTGYRSFDEVKNLPSGVVRTPLQFFDTSHNTFLTYLVEMGLLGAVIILGHWAWVVTRAVRLRRAGHLVGWLSLGWLVLLIVYVVNAMLIDMRFYSYAAVLPWLALGFLRRASRDDIREVPYKDELSDRSG
jgi:O-antigen ligase